MRKFMRAVDVDEERIQFPCIIQPKIDGVRAGIHACGTLTTRQLKPFENKWTQEYFSNKDFAGLDGEFIWGEPTASDACRSTTSASSTIRGAPGLTLWAFDVVLPETINSPYVDRLEMLDDLVTSLAHPMIQQMPWQLARNLDDMLSQEEEWLEEGYEGLIVRGLWAGHKEGYSTVREGGLLRVKRFIDGEIIVTSIQEGQHNANEATINEVGRTARSSHKANKSGNGMVGAVEGRLLKDCVYRGKTVLKAGQTVTVGAGEMSHKERKHYFENPDKLLNQVAKFQFFPHGIKDKPRFPTFQTLRSKSDL